MNVVIVDDEKKSRIVLRNHIERSCPQLKIIGEGDDVRSGVTLIESKRPQLLFLDVEMPDGTGFDLLERLDSRLDFGVIFITAYGHYAVKAFRYSAIDYITKPIDPNLLVVAVEKAEREVGMTEISKKLEVLISNKEKPEKIALPTSDGIMLVRISEIIRCQSDGNYTNIYLKNGNKILITRTLKEYASLLGENGFHRIHHSHLINIDYVDRYVNRDGGYVIMVDGSEVEISRRKKEEFLIELLKK